MNTLRRTVIVVFCLGLSYAAAGTTYTVTSGADTGAGTLRWAIETANTNLGADRIEFNLPPPYEVRPVSALPSMVGEPVTLDGATQPGYTGTPLVTVDGSVVGAGFGLETAYSTSVVIRAVNVIAWGVGIRLSYSLSNRVENCRVCSNNFSGVRLDDSIQCVIGATNAGTGNILFRNGSAGVQIAGDRNRVQGNRIGTDGRVALPNDSGVHVVSGSGNTIGGTSEWARNIISGNQNQGILLQAAASNTAIEGNFIGTDETGTNALANNQGILVVGSWNTIGGTSAPARNVIAGNSNAGAEIGTTNAHDNAVQSNWLGLGADGRALPNSHGVILNSGARGNTIGGGGSRSRNIISGNQYSGVFIETAGTTNNRIWGNYIGTGTSGTTRVGNGSYGIWVKAADNRIGGGVSGQGNIVSGNELQGIYVDNANAWGNIIEGNGIGVDATGSLALSNASHGIYVLDAPGTSIGGTGDAMNVISGNGGAGIVLRGASCTKTTVRGNRIGLPALFIGNLGNGGAGIEIDNTANNSIGSPLPGEGTVVAHNGSDGIRILSMGAVSNRLSANSIYENRELGIDLQNDGVTANDALDPDTGPNRRQNFPVLTLASNAGATMIVVGTLNSGPGTQYSIEFFGNRNCDGTGYGEGEVYLGEMLVDTDGSGNAAFTNSLLITPTPPPSFVTVTARDMITSETSEFSRYAFVDSDGDGMPDGWEYANFGSATGGDSAGHGDADGVPNLDEFLADTEPHKDTDYPRLSRISVGGATVRVEAPSSASRVYTLQYSVLIDPSSWIPGSVQTGTGETIGWNRALADLTPFYRCAVALP